MNILDAKEKCGEMNSVVYLYVYDSDDINIKSEQGVWSRLLRDLKEEEGNNIVLIPIAADSDLTTLDSLIKRFGVQKYPAVVINEKHVIYDIESASNIEKYLK